MSHAFSKISNFIGKILGGVAVIFAGIAILGNFLFTPKLYQKFESLFHRNKFYIYIFIIVLIVIIAGGFFAWQYFGALEKITTWKTYKAEDVGFEVRYPSNLREEWKLPEESFTLHEAWGEQIGKRFLLFSMTDSGKVYSFGFSAYSNSYNLTIEEFSQKLMSWMNLGCQLKTTEDILLGQEQILGVKFIFYNCNNARTPDEIISQVLVKENNNIIEISGIGSLSNSEFIKHFNLMLSTFKFFTEKEEVKEEAADWKIYQNYQAGFSLKYPSYWGIGEDTDIGGTYRPDANRVWFLESEPMNVDIEYWTKLGEGMNALQDWIERRKDDLTNPTRGIQEVFEFKEENITLDNLSAKKISVVNTTKFGKSRWIGVFVQRGELMYEISAEIPFGQQNIVLPIFNQILSTFRFIEIPDETAKWKTYKEEGLGFEFKYPQKYIISTFADGKQPEVIVAS